MTLTHLQRIVLQRQLRKSGRLLRGQPLADPSPAEIRVLRLRARGMTLREIAAKLGITEQHAKGLVANVYVRLGVGGHPGDPFVKALLRLGWLRVPPRTPKERS